MFASDQSGSLKRLHRPNRFRVWLHEYEGGEWVSMSLRALIPFTLNAGLRRPRRGFTLVAATEKLGVGKLFNPLGSEIFFDGMGKGLSHLFPEFGAIEQAFILLIGNESHFYEDRGDVWSFQYNKIRQPIGGIF